MSTSRDGAQQVAATGIDPQPDNAVAPGVAKVAFRVFFDGVYDHCFATALAVADNDEALAATLCSRAFGKAYARWSVVGRTPNPLAFVLDVLENDATTVGSHAQPNPGVGWKPWVYVTAIESGAARRRAAALFLAGAAVVTLVFAATLSLRSNTDQQRENVEVSQPDADMPEASRSTWPTSTRLVETRGSISEGSTTPTTEKPTAPKFVLDLSGLPETVTESSSGWVLPSSVAPTQPPIAPATTQPAPLSTNAAPASTTSTTRAPQPVATPTTVATIAPAPTTLAPTTVAPAVVAPTTAVPPTTTPTTTVTPTTVTPTTVAPSTTIATAPAPKPEKDEGCWPTTAKRCRTND